MSADKGLFSYNLYDEKAYGPIDLPSQTCGPLLNEQERYVRRAFGDVYYAQVWTMWGNLGRVTVHEALPVCFG